MRKTRARSSMRSASIRVSSEVCNLASVDEEEGARVSEPERSAEVYGVSKLLTSICCSGAEVWKER